MSKELAEKRKNIYDLSGSGFTVDLKWGLNEPLNIGTENSRFAANKDPKLTLITSKIESFQSQISPRIEKKGISGS